MDHKLVIAVRSDLELSRGKLAVQVAHAAVMAAFEARTHHRKWFADWWAEGQKKVVVKGGTVGGFNVIDVDSLHEKVDRPVVTVTRRKPDLAAIETALRRRFDDWEDRLRLMRRHRVESVRLGQGSLWISSVGTDREAVREAL